MAYTVAQVFTQVRLAYGDFPDDATSLKMFNDEDAYICSHIKIRQDSSTDLTLVAGTREYALGADVMRVWQAVYYTSAGSYSFLTPTSVDELDYGDKLWRQRDRAQPREFYESGGYIGLYPTPATSTSGGYPKVTLYTQSRSPVTSTSDPLPTQVVNADAWIYGICRRWAALMHPEDTDGWENLAREARANLATSIMRRLPRQRPMLKVKLPSIYGG